MRPSPKIALVVLNWNNPKDTLACLDSMTRLTYGSFEVYVVDNGSSDGSPERIGEAFPDVHMIRLPENRGYGGGMNEGIAAAFGGGSDYVLCLNNDMTFDPGFLEPLVHAAGGEGFVPFPAIYQGEDPERLDSAGNRLSYVGLTSLIAHGAKEASATATPDYTELPLLSRELLNRVGAYKEEYFAFYEDVDLSLRAQSAGWHLSLVPESRVYHRRGSTTRRVPGLVSYYSIRNRLLMMRDNGTRGRWLLTALHVIFVTLPFQLFEALANSGSRHSPGHLLAGLRDGLLPWRRGVRRHWPPSA